MKLRTIALIAADPLALFGREAELLDRIGGSERLNGLLRLHVARPGEEQSCN